MKTYLLASFMMLSCVQAMAADDSIKSFRNTLSALVAADTSNPPGNEAKAVAIFADRLKHEKIPFEVIEFAPGRKNLVARLKGNGQAKPLLLLAHIDVVGTKDQNWSVPPHAVTEKDGFLYGRGVADDLGMAVLNLETFIRLKHEGVALKRDVILGLTGDEESGGLGIRYILEHRPELFDASIALNEGAGPVQDDAGKILMVRMQVAEKIYQDFTFVAKGETGHSSVPKKDNAIYHLAKALERLGQAAPPERLLPVTRAYFTALAPQMPGPVGKAMSAIAQSKGKLPAAALKALHENPTQAVMLSTTCVATMLSGGTGRNALPPEARANVNCRILPDETVAQTQAWLTKVVDDPKIEVVIEKDNGAAGPSPVEGEIPTALAELVKMTWPGIPLIPMMQSGATDSRFLRPHGVAAYGFNPIVMFEKDLTRAHGIDERIPVNSLAPALGFQYRLVMKLAGP